MIIQKEHTRDLSVLKSGLRYSADWTWVAAANLPCVDRLICSAIIMVSADATINRDVSHQVFRP